MQPITIANNNSKRDPKKSKKIPKETRGYQYKPRATNNGPKAKQKRLEATNTSQGKGN